MSQNPLESEPPHERSLAYWPALGCLGFLVFPLAIVAFILAMPIFGVLWLVGSLYPLDPHEADFDVDPSTDETLAYGRRRIDSPYKLPFRLFPH